MKAWLRVTLASLALLLPSPAAAQETIVDGLTYMLGWPSTWNAGAPKLVSDGLFYYAVFCGRANSPQLCTVARKRGDGGEPWTFSTRVFWSSQPATVVIDRKGRLNIFFNDYQLKHFRIDVPSVNLDGWLQIATDFLPQVGYLHASYNAVSDEILITFNETAGYRLYVGRKVGEGAWTYAPVPAAPPGAMYLYARTVGRPGRYAILVGEHVFDGLNNRYTSALLFESASAMGPWTTRRVYLVSGANLGIPYENWVLANDLQFDAAGRLRALLHITEGGSGHANPREGLFVLREEDSYAPRYIGNPIEDGFTLYADPSGPLLAFAGYPILGAPYGVLWFRSDDDGLTWQQQAGGFASMVNPALVDLRSGSMIGPDLHLLGAHWDLLGTRAFDKLLFGTVPLSPPNSADRFAYDIVDGDGTLDSTRGFRDVPSGRFYSYLYDRHPDGSFSWTYTYTAGSYSQSYTGDWTGSYRYTNSDGADLSETRVLLTSVSPAALALGSAATLAVNGANFIPGAAIRVNGIARDTTFVSATRLTTGLTPGDATLVGDTTRITVLNPDGATSNGLSVTIGASPATLTSSSANVIGGGIATFTVANGPANPRDWVGWFCPATLGDLDYVDWKYLTNSRTAAASGQAAATITFTAPTGNGAVCMARLFADNGFTRLSSSATVTVTAANPVPAITSLGPDSVPAGNAASVSIAGTNFLPTSVARVNGAARTTTYLSPTLLRVAVLAGDVATVGVNPSITVVTGAPGGGTSNAAVLVVVSAPTVTGPGSSLAGAVSIAVNNGPGNRTDWVGWFCPRTGADSAYIDWKYLNDSRTAPPTGLSSGTVTFQMPAGAGASCEARLFANNGFSLLATSNAIAQLGGGGGGSFQLTMGPTAVDPGGALTVTAVNGGGIPGSRLDWVGLFCPSTSTHAAYVDWHYMNGTKTAPVSAWASPASITFTAPITAGMNCAARLFSNNGFSLLTSSEPVTVRTVVISLTLASAVVSTGGTISVTIANGPGNARDWVGLYCTSAANVTSSDWKYFSGSRTPPGAGTTSATLNFTAPGAAGTCVIRLFADDGFTPIASSANITVQ